MVPKPVAEDDASVVSVDPCCAHLVDDETIALVEHGAFIRTQACCMEDNHYLVVPPSRDTKRKFELTSKCAHQKKECNLWLDTVSGHKHKHDALEISGDEEENVLPLKCDCKKKHHFFSFVTKMFPIGKLDKDDVFHVTKRRLHRLTAAPAFDGLKPSHEHWCFNWWHSVNVFGFRECTPLPDCYLGMMHKAYLNENGEAFAGFKH